MSVHSVVSYLTSKGGDKYKSRKRRVTKGQLGQIFRKGVEQVSPEIGTEVVESGDNVELNVRYMITHVEEVTTEVSFYQGIRVEMTGEAGQDGSIMLWKRPKVGKNSKLGVFVDLLGSNTDDWVNKLIVFTKWEKNNRIVLPATLPSKVAQAVVEAGATIIKKPKTRKKKLDLDAAPK